MDAWDQHRSLREAGEARSDAFLKSFAGEEGWRRASGEEPDFSNPALLALWSNDPIALNPKDAPRQIIWALALPSGKSAFGELKRRLDEVLKAASADFREKSADVSALPPGRGFLAAQKAAWRSLGHDPKNRAPGVFCLQLDLSLLDISMKEKAKRDEAWGKAREIARGGSDIKWMGNPDVELIESQGKSQELSCRGRAQRALAQSLLSAGFSILPLENWLVIRQGHGANGADIQEQAQAPIPALVALQLKQAIGQGALPDKKQSRI